MNWEVVIVGMRRERKLVVIGAVIWEPHQRPGRVGAGLGGETVRGRAASRLGRSGVFEESMVVLERGGGVDARAERKCLWKIIPEPPSPRAW